MGKEKVRQLFQSYAECEGFMHVYSDGANFVFGFDHNVAYNLLISPWQEYLIKKAKTDYETFKLVKEGAQFALRQGKALPQDVVAFIADSMENTFKPPKKKTGTPANFDFNWTVRLALWELSKCGYPPTKNDERSISEVCGIDIVLEVLNELDMCHDRTFGAIKAIWVRGNKSHGKPSVGHNSE